jgi:hypothetical protein
MKKQAHAGHFTIHNSEFTIHHLFLLEATPDRRGFGNLAGLHQARNSEFLRRSTIYDHD